MPVPNRQLTNNHWRNDMKNPKFAKNLLAAALAWYEHSKHDMGDRANAVANAANLMNLAPDMPKVVCLCGNTRFYEQFQKSNFDETMAGNVVLSVGFYPHGPAESRAHGGDVGITIEQKVALDVLHKRKIDLVDEILVLNVGGYIGDSTRSEVEYARATGKPVRWLEYSSDVALGEWAGGVENQFASAEVTA